MSTDVEKQVTAQTALAAARSRALAAWARTHPGVPWNEAQGMRDYFTTHPEDYGHYARKMVQGRGGSQAPVQAQQKAAPPWVPMTADEIAKGIEAHNAAYQHARATPIQKVLPTPAGPDAERLAYTALLEHAQTLVAKGAVPAGANALSAAIESRPDLYQQWVAARQETPR